MLQVKIKFRLKFFNPGESLVTLSPSPYYSWNSLWVWGSTVYYLAVQFYSWFKIYFPLCNTHYHTQPYPKAKQTKDNWSKDNSGQFRVPKSPHFQYEKKCKTLIQSNLAISNSVNSKSPLFRRKIECPWIYPSSLRFPGYFEAPLFQTFFHFPWDFEIAGFDCMKMKFFGMRIKNYFDMKKCTLTLLRKRGVRQLRNGLLNLKIYIYFGIKVWTLLETFI